MGAFPSNMRNCIKKEELPEGLTIEEWTQVKYQDTLKANNHEVLKDMLEAGLPVDMEFDFLDDELSQRSYQQILYGLRPPLTVLEVAILCCKGTEMSTCVKLLFEYGLDLEIYQQKYCSPLFIACHIANLKLIEFLLEKGASAEDELLVFEMIACFRWCYKDTETHAKYVKIIELLLEHGADVKARQNIPEKVHCGNITMMHWAVINWTDGMSHICELLLKHGADINAKCNYYDDNSVPMMLFAVKVKRNDTSCLEFLLHHGADINAVNLKGQTVLHYQIVTTKVLSFLLDHIHNINAVDFSNNTALDVGIRTMQAAECSVYPACDRPSRDCCIEWVIEMIRRGGQFNNISKEIIEYAMSETQSKSDVLLGYIVNSFCNWNFNIDIEYVSIHSERTAPTRARTHSKFFAKICKLDQEPRSLQHQCRCTLRKYLLQRYMKVITQLSLPQDIETYLVMREPCSLI